MLDQLIATHGHGYGNGYGHKDHRSSGYGFEEHKKYESRMESEGGYFDRQARYDHRVRLPGNHGRPPMTHMPPCDEDVEEFYKSSQSHHTTVLPHHGKNHHNMGNGWQGRHEDAYPGEHGMKHHGEHGMQHHGGHGMQHHGEHGMQHHGEHGMQHHGEHGMKHHGEHGMQHHGEHGMKHHDRLMAPQVLPHHVYMNPNHGTGSGAAVMVKSSENWRVTNSGGGYHKAGWGSKGL